MRSIPSKLLLALLAVLALSVVTTAAASAALPEFKPVPTKHKFTATSGTFKLAAALDPTTCSKSTTVGEITGASTVGKVVVTYTGCEGTGSGGKCKMKSVGAAEGEIVTKSLKGELGTVAKTEAASERGILLQPEVGKTFAELAAGTCEIGGNIEGKVAGEVTPIGKKQTTLSFVFAASGSSQKIKHITVAGGAVEPKLLVLGNAATETVTDEVTFEEALEVT
jgi:hypothetical protein